MVAAASATEAPGVEDEAGPRWQAADLMAAAVVVSVGDGCTGIVQLLRTVLCIAAAAAAGVAGLQDGLAQQPPMGWRRCLLF